MASAILQFRRGIYINDLSLGEPFLDTATESLYIGGASNGFVIPTLGGINSGSLFLTGDISASNATFGGTVTISGDIVIGGSIILGDNPVDVIELNGVLSGSLIPATGSTYNVGSVTDRYNTIYAESLNVVNGITASSIDFDSINNLPTLVSGSSQINHDSASGYVVVEHIDHTNVSITAGDGLSGGGFITVTRTLTLDTGSTHFTEGVSSIAQPTPAGTVSGSSQLTSSYDDRYVLESETGSLGYRNYVDSTSGSLIGIQNGVNTSFTASQNGYLSGSVLAFVAGYPLSNGNGITESVPSTGIIDFDTAPENYDIVIIQYSN